MVRHEQKLWTKEDHEKLISLIKEGRHEKEMAKALGRTEQAINVRVKLIKKNHKFVFREPVAKKKRPPIELFSPIYTEAL